MAVDTPAGPAEAGEARTVAADDGSRPAAAWAAAVMSTAHVQPTPAPSSGHGAPEESREPSHEGPQHEGRHDGQTVGDTQPPTDVASSAPSTDGSGASGSAPAASAAHATVVAAAEVGGATTGAHPPGDGAQTTNGQTPATAAPTPETTADAHASGNGGMTGAVMMNMLVSVLAPGDLLTAAGPLTFDDLPAGARPAPTPPPSAPAGNAETTLPPMDGTPTISIHTALDDLDPPAGPHLG